MGKSHWQQFFKMLEREHKIGHRNLVIRMYTNGMYKLWLKTLTLHEDVQFYRKRRVSTECKSCSYSQKGRTDGNLHLWVGEVIYTL